MTHDPDDLTWTDPKAIVRSDPAPVPVLHGDKDGPLLDLDEALALVRSRDSYRVVKTSDPV